MDSTHLTHVERASSLGMSDLNFVAIDFETANPDQASVCQVGIAKVLNGTIVETTSWLVVPPTGVDSFERRFIGIHGITPRQVRRSGISWRDSLQRLHHLADGLPFVAHNVSFDRTVYRRASERIGVAVPDSAWFDTVALARRFVASPNHRLPTVVEALGLPDFRHHEAEADAIASAQIALTISKQHQLPTMDALWPPRKPRRRSYPARRFTRVGDLPKPNGEAHPEHPFFGHHVVITGDLQGMSRDDFIVKVAELGGQPQLNVTKKTTMLVIAAHEVLPAEYDHSKGSSKEKKAGEYIAAGQSIELLGSVQAVAYLEHKAVTLTSPLPEPEPEPAREVQAATRAEPPTSAPVTEPVSAPPLQQQDIPVPPRESRTPLKPDTTRKERSERRQAVPTTSPRSAKLPPGIVKVLWWTLIVVSALLVVLFFGSLTVLLFDSTVDFSIVHWLIGFVLFIPISAAPGVLGVYFLRCKNRQS